MSNPVVQQLMRQGEERLAKVATQLLASESFVQVVQAAVQRALSVRGVLDRNLKLALAALNLPSTADIHGLNQRLDDLERLLGDLEDQIGTVLDSRATPTGERGTRRGSEVAPERAAAAGDEPD